jgi:hypothetical protein
MEESHYRALLEEVRSDVANANQAIVDAEQTIDELATLETYLLSKVDGGAPVSKPAKVRPAGKSGGSRPAKKVAPVQEKEESGAGGKGMQTVEFGPDGFPST